MNLVILTRQFGTYTGATVSTIELLKRIYCYFNRVVIVTMRSELEEFSNVEIVLVKDRKHLQLSLDEIVQNDGEWVGYSDDHLGWMLKESRVPYIHTYHGNWPGVRYLNAEMFLKSFYFIPQYKRTIVDAEISVSVSKYMKSKFVDNYSKKSEVIYNGVLQTGGTSKKKKSRRIMMIGNVDRRKYALAIKLFNEFKGESIPPIDIYGSIIDHKIGKRLSGFPFVNLMGKKSYIDFNSYSRLLSTSSCENLPVSIVEALLQELPVISFDVGGIGEVVTKDNGEIIPLNDFSLMRNKLLSNRVYPFEGEELLKEKFNWDYSAKKYMELFKKIGMKD